MSRCGETETAVSPPPVHAPTLTVSSTATPCFSVVASKNSPLATEAFRAHELAGNGSTWAAILQAIVLRHGREVTALEAPPPDYPGFGAPFSIEHRGRSTWYTLDDEADAAVFCTPDPGLRDAVRADVETVNAEADALTRAIAESAAFGDE